MSKEASFDLRDFLPYLLNQAAEMTSLDFQRHYKARYGMLRTEWRVVFHLGRYGDMTAKEICDRARIHKTKVSRAVSALEKRRFLNRAVVQDDRRHEMLSLTSTGKSAFKELYAEAQKFQHELTAEFTREEIEVLRRCLVKIAQL